MMKRIGITGLVLAAALALSGLATSSASAAVKCYEVSAFKEHVQAGNWSENKCLTSAGILMGKFVEAELETFVTENLWCAKTTAETGTWATNQCSKSGGKEVNSHFIEVIVPGGMALPEFVTKSSWKGESGAGALRASGVEIKCESGANSGEMEASKKLGTFDIDFKGCSSAITGTKCTSEGDAEGVVLTEGTWHLVLTTKSGADVHLIWFLVKEFKAKCGTVTITTKGNVLGEITPANKLTKNYVIKVETPVVGGATQQEYTSFENDNGETVSASLLSEAALGFHAATEASAGNTITTVLDTLIIN